MRLPCPWHFPHFLLEQKRREHIQEALGKGTILNDEVAESEQGGVLFIRRVSGIPPIVRLSHYRIGSRHSSPEDERTVKRPISMGSFVVSQKEPFRSLILSFPFEIDYTTVNSRRSS